MKFSDKVLTVFWMLLAFFLGIFLFSIIVGMPGTIDMQEHNTAIERIIEGKYLMPPHFLYFTLVILLSKISSVSTASVLILSIALAFKLLATKQFIEHGLRSDEDIDVDVRKVLSKIIFPLSFFLLFLTNMPNKLFGFDNLPPISWHNSTIILLMPFSLWLLWYSYSYLQEQKKYSILYAGIAGFLSVLIKPNFILVFITVFPLFLIYKYRFTSFTFKAGAIVFLFVTVLVAQYVYNYNYISVHSLSKYYTNVKIAISPFEAWHRISHNLFFSFFAWALYPILFLALYFKTAIRSLFYNYSLSFFTVAMIIFILFTEKDASGKDIAAVNFIWQVIVCHYIWFLTSMIKHMKIVIKRKSFVLKDYILSAVFIAYIVSGFIYVIRTIVLA